jgi:hypothetical protein
MKKNENMKKISYKTKSLNLEINKPIIFNKKSNIKSKVIPLKTTMTNIGPTRHFTPASQEWYNSVYTYNKNYTKLLPIADKNLMKIVRSYFNFFFKKKFKKSFKHRILPIRFRRLSIRRIFVGKGDIKHTYSKVIITLYVYNYEKRFLMNKAKEYFQFLVNNNEPLSIVLRKNEKNISYLKLLLDNVLSLKTISQLVQKYNPFAKYNRSLVYLEKKLRLKKLLLTNLYNKEILYKQNNELLPNKRDIFAKYWPVDIVYERSSNKKVENNPLFDSFIVDNENPNLLFLPSNLAFKKYLPEITKAIIENAGNSSIIESLIKEKEFQDTSSIIKLYKIVNAIYDINNPHSSYASNASHKEENKGILSYEDFEFFIFNKFMSFIAKNNIISKDTKDPKIFFWGKNKNLIEEFSSFFIDKYNKKSHKKILKYKNRNSSIFKDKNFENKDLLLFYYQKPFLVYLPFMINSNNLLSNILPEGSASQEPTYEDYKNLINNNDFKVSLNNEFKDFRKKSLKLEYILKKRSQKRLQFNKDKFNEYFLSKLTSLVRGIYNKNVEFNIVNLKKLHLNSDIYTQAIALKLKNRNNKLHRVLTSSMSKVKIPYVNRVKEKYFQFNKQDLLINKIRNIKINSLLSNFINNKDPLNKLLLSVFSCYTRSTKYTKETLSIVKHSSSLANIVINSLKHITMAGVRLEAKGRLTRRFTASRSVFKLKWKGGLKNVDSSFKGLSAVLLRGHAKSNVQYSSINNKRRTGAYGVKGWVSNK